MLKHLLVTGKTGQVGQSLQNIAPDYPQYQFTFVGRDQLNLADASSIKAFFQQKRFDVIINCAAYTAVDKAESETELAEQVNHTAVAQLAQIAKQQDTVLIHISTDYVFDGKHYYPYMEEDAANPQNVYGLTKLKGEQSIQAIAPRGAIIRTSWVYSEFGHNFVKTMLRLGQERETLNVIFDQIGSPTYAGDLAHAIMQIISQPDKLEDCEVYHYANEGVCSWYDFANAIFDLHGIKCRVCPIETKDYPTPAKRPYYSLMNKVKIKQTYELQILYWRDALKKCLTNLQK